MGATLKDMETTDITVAKTIAAKPEDVFDAWLDRNRPGGPWFGPARVILNPTVDGLFFFAVEHEGKMWAHYGRFTRIERPSVIECAWMSEATKGLESLVTVTFAARDGATEVTLRHSGVPDNVMGRRHKDGWTWTLNNLAESFSKKKDSAA